MSTTDSTADRTLTTRLKDDNWALHQIAERSEGPASMIKGSMPIDGYKSVIVQQWVMSRALDRAMQGALDARPDLASFVLPKQMLGPYLEEDLMHFGVCPAHVRPEPGTERFIAEVESKKDDPMFLLGLHYVRLGACNGNRFVAKVVRKAYELPESGEGTRYLDPFGEAQRDEWYAFKGALDSLELTAEEADRVFAGTRAAYEHAICHGMDRHYSGDELLAKHQGSLDKDAFDKGHSVHVPANG